MSYRIETVSKDSAGREDLIAFLLNSPGLMYAEEVWRSRLKHWWDDNPVCDESSTLGWVLLHDSQVVGFMGCIPLMYEFAGQLVPAVAATTWRVADDHRGQSLQLFLQLLQLSKKIMVIHSSPIPTVAAILEKSGFLFRKSCMRHYLLMGPLVSRFSSWWLTKGASFCGLSSNLRLVSNLSEVREVAASTMHKELLERKISSSYLKWLLSAPMENLGFVGCVDDSGLLTSFLVLKLDQVKGLPAWLVVDWFTARSDANELRSLAHTICRKPSLISSQIRGRFLITSSFDDDNIWTGSPAVLRRRTPALYYYKTPLHLKSVAKYFVLAESDYLF